MNVRLIYVTNSDGSKSVRVSRELTRCGGCSTGMWWEIGRYNTERGARIAAAACARKFDEYLNWMCPQYIDYRDK